MEKRTLFLRPSLNLEQWLPNYENSSQIINVQILYIKIFQGAFKNVEPQALPQTN